MEAKEAISLFDGFKKVPWFTLHRVYGNSHHTIIGLLVEWWISLSFDRHEALEAPPSLTGNQQSPYSDAIFCEDEKAVGVLEVEGNSDSKGKKRLRKLDTIRSHLAHVPRWPEMRFGILAIYSYGDRCKPAEVPAITEAARQLSKDHGDKAIYLLHLEKSRSKAYSKLQTMSNFTGGVMDRVTGKLLWSGKVLQDHTFFSRKKMLAGCNSVTATR